MKMSYLFLLAVILPASIWAQDLKIPDANFKKALVAAGVDTNGDGEIQVAEARVVTRLYVDKANISSLVGIKSFTSLQEFGFYDNNIKELDLSGMTSVRAIYGANNKMETANVKGMTGLETLYLNDNNIRWLDLSGLKQLREIKMYHNSLGKLEALDLRELQKIEVQYNRITECKLAGLSALKEINLNKNMLRSLDLTPCKMLEAVRVDENPILSFLDVRGLRVLKLLECGDNMLTNLNMSGTVSLQGFSW